MESFTIKQLNEIATSKGIKIPSGLRKTQILEWLSGAIEEKKNGIVPNISSSDLPTHLLIPKYADSSIDWLIHLHQYGWAVTDIPNWNSKYIDMFFSFLESCCDKFKRDNISTWKGDNLPVMSRGILKQYIGHTEMVWQIRELCAGIFARMWGCREEDLLCSFDGGCFMVPGKSGTFRQWIHNDTPRNYEGKYTFCSVQGIVNFIDNGLEDGGLLLLEGSRDIIEQYMTKYPSYGISWGLANIEDPLLKGRSMLKICAKAGQIILFDTRIFHCNVNSWRYVRMCTYVSMQPRLGASLEELAKRRELYENGRMTGHWCYGKWFKETAKEANARSGINNRPVKIEIAGLNPLRSKLIGY